MIEHPGNGFPALPPVFATRATNDDPHLGQTFDPCRSRSDATCSRWVAQCARSGN